MLESQPEVVFVGPQRIVQHSHARHFGAVAPAHDSAAVGARYHDPGDGGSMTVAIFRSRLRTLANVDGAVPTRRQLYVVRLDPGIQHANDDSGTWLARDHSVLIIDPCGRKVRRLEELRYLPRRRHR